MSKTQKRRLDATDLLLLQLLQNDNQQSHVQIARLVDVAQSTLSYQVRRLTESGHIKHNTAVLDPIRLGFKSLAFFEVECRSPAVAAKVAGTIAALPWVQEVHQTTKHHAVLIKVRCRNDRELDERKSTVCELQGVRRVKVMYVMRALKESLVLPL